MLLGFFRPVSLEGSVIDLRGGILTLWGVAIPEAAKLTLDEWREASPLLANLP